LSSSAYGKALQKKLKHLRLSAERDVELNVEDPNPNPNPTVKPLNQKNSLLLSENSLQVDAKKSNLPSQSSLSTWVLSSYINNLPPSDLTINVSRDDFLLAVKSIKPSVSLLELEHFEALGKTYDDTHVQQ
jgi:SpoVK/Ycf46/Vps4 family AAA+-type ATPase